MWWCSQCVRIASGELTSNLCKSFSLARRTSCCFRGLLATLLRNLMSTFFACRRCIATCPNPLTVVWSFWRSSQRLHCERLLRTSAKGSCGSEVLPPLTKMCRHLLQCDKQLRSEFDDFHDAGPEPFNLNLRTSSQGAN